MERDEILHGRETFGKINQLGDVQLKAALKSSDSWRLSLAAVLGRPQGIEIPLSCERKGHSSPNRKKSYQPRDNRGGYSAAVHL